MRMLAVQALHGDSAAYRKLGQCFLKGNGCKRDEELAKLLLEQAMEMGDEEGFFIYHKWFSQGKQVIDSGSYEAMCREYENMEDGEEKEKLERYLRL